MRAWLLVTAAAAALTAQAGGALADKIKNPMAVFSGLDKITGRIISFEVAIDETVQFGALQLTPRVCYSRPQTEAPSTDAFLEVDEVTFANEHRRIFSGWMYAASPGLHGIEHAVYDVWLTECKGGTDVIAEPKEIDPADDPLKTVKEGKEPREPRDTAGARPRRPAQQAARSPGRVDVAPPQGVPVAPRQPSQRYYPTNVPPPGVQQPPPKSLFDALFGR